MCRVGYYQDLMEQRHANTERLMEEAPLLFNGFNALAKEYYQPGVLDRKQKELMAVLWNSGGFCRPPLFDTE